MPSVFGCRLLALELNSSAPHRANQVKDLDSGGNADSHRGEGEEAIGVRVYAIRCRLGAIPNGLPYIRRRYERNV